MENIQIIDIAEYLTAEKEIPKGQHYRIQIDREFYVVKQECMTGRELLLLAGKKPPERWQLTQKFRFNRTEKVELDEKVDLAVCGIERFVTLPLDCTDGRPSRQEFVLPVADATFLDSLNLHWETVHEGGTRWLLIRDWPLPNGFTTAAADIALLLDADYPITQIDMAYFHPQLALSNGRAINALNPQSIEGKSYQRWSRHRTPENPWRMGIDDISTHLALVTTWLERETTK